MRKWLFLMVITAFIFDCETPAPIGPASWTAVDDAVNAAAPQFTSGLTVEVILPAGVVHSVSAGGFANTDAVPVASASKWVSTTVILRLVDEGVFGTGADHGLDLPTSALLTDNGGLPWSGNLGNARLRHLLSFTTGISGDTTNVEICTSIDQAVKLIYSTEAATAAVPGTYFYYGSNHLRIAARMAEIATGKVWNTIVRDELGDPLGWPATFKFFATPLGTTNYDPAGNLYINGQEYAKFVCLQLRQGFYGNNRLVPEALIDIERTDGFGPTTYSAYSPYQAVPLLGYAWHYGLGNWLETAGGGAPTPADPVIRWSSTGMFGWAPWVAADGSYAAIIMTKQTSTGPGTGITPSENLKVQLAPLIRQSLASGTVTVVRNIP
jgi:D-alanyl-D-alanine-carboxypeptidase/D-alanyl-D-alanine-endopeptidase